MAERTERLRLLLIGSTVVAAVITLVLGVPRARQFFTPRIERVWVASAVLGDSVASTTPKAVLEGTPVTLLAIIEARPPFGGDNRFYGTVEQVAIEPGGAPVPVEAWRDWWYPIEFLWLKVEPLHGYANPEFEADFDLTQVVFTDSFQVAWGFAPTHAADVTPAGDIFPDLTAGTMRFAARAVVRDWRDRILQQVQSASADQVHEPEPSMRPHRITVRAGDDPFGQLMAYAGLAYVPYLSEEGHPADRFIGGTVLDFWLRAQRAAGAYEGTDGPLGPARRGSRCGRG